MKLHIPKIFVEVLTESDRERYVMLDSTRYGVQLQSVAGKLLRNPTESGGSILRTAITTTKPLRNQG